jgi:hypothetical protein
MILWDSWSEYQLKATSNATVVAKRTKFAPLPFLFDELLPAVMKRIPELAPDKVAVLYPEAGSGTMSRRRRKSTASAQSAATRTRYIRAPVP